MKPIKDSIIVFGGLARDCACNLARNLNEIEKIRTKVKKLYICILENDSSDNTPEVMDNFCSCHDNVIVKHFKETHYDVSSTTGASMSRICRLTKYRNMLLENMQSYCGNSDFFVIIDWDLDEFDSTQVLKAIENAPSDWGAIFANGRYKWQFKENRQTGFRDKNKIYDSFAILEDGMSIESIQKDDNSIYNRFVIARKFGFLLNKYRYVKCTSAFGGIGIYKSKCLEGCSYSTMKKGDWYICEHLAFNYTIR